MSRSSEKATKVGREGGMEGGPEAPQEESEGATTRGPNGTREGVGSLITLGSLIEFWGPEGPPP